MLYFFQVTLIMSQISTIIYFGRRWESCSDGFERYIGYQNMHMVVPKNIRYKKLLRKICHLLGVYQVHYKVTLKFEVSSSTIKLRLIPLKNDDDAILWLSLQNNMATPLCVTVDTRGPESNAEASMEQKEGYAK